MTFSSVHKRVVGIASLIAVLSFSSVVVKTQHKATLTLQNNQAVTQAQTAQGISDGTYVSTGNCTLSGGALMREADMNYCIRMQPNCFTNTNAVPTFSQVAACLATPGPNNTPTPTPTATPTATPAGATSIGAVIDPWLTDGSTYWPTYSGTPLFVANTQVSGSPSNAQTVYGTGVIYQSFNSGSVLNAGTPISISAYMENATASITYLGSTCSGSTTSTATGSAYLLILNSSNTTVASVNATTATLAGYTLNYTVPVSGVYREAISVKEDTINYTGYHSNVHGICSGTASSISAYGYATRLTAAN